MLRKIKNSSLALITIIRCAPIFIKYKINPFTTPCCNYPEEALRKLVRKVPENVLEIIQYILLTKE